MKKVYCAACGTSLLVTRKALPKYGKIIDMISPHVCKEEVDLNDLNLNPREGVAVDGGKFVQKLNELTHPSAVIGAVSTMDLRDRRKEEHIRSDISAAPRGILEGMKSMGASTPAREFVEIDDGEE